MRLTTYHENDAQSFDGLVQMYEILEQLLEFLSSSNLLYQSIEVIERDDNVALACTANLAQVVSAFAERIRVPQGLCKIKLL